VLVGQKKELPMVGFEPAKTSWAGRWSLIATAPKRHYNRVQ
jgi:hypothetical protein